MTTPDGSAGEKVDSVESDFAETSLPRELLSFIVENKKYWLIPILLVVVILGFLLALSSTAAAPFIYTLF